MFNCFITIFFKLYILCNIILTACIFLAKLKLNHLMINGSEDGLILESVETECKAVNIHGSRHGVAVSNSTVTFSDCVFTASPMYMAGTGIHLGSPSTVVLTGCLIVGSSYGIVSYFTQHSLYISDCSFINNTISAIHLVHSNADAVTPATLLLHRTLFSGNSRAVHVVQSVAIDILVEATNNTIEFGSVNEESDDVSVLVSGIYIDLKDVGSRARLTLQQNTFRNLPYPAVSISRCHDSPLRSNHSTVVDENHFTGISQTAVVIRCMDSAVTLIQSNTFLQNVVNVGSSCLNLSSRAVGGRSSVELRINRNEFRENSGTYVGSIVGVAPGEVSTLSEFVSNTIVDNFARDSTIYSNYSDLNMHFNTFSNQRTRFELLVDFPAEQVANCTLNWWGVSTEVGIATRIFDHSDMASVGSVLYVPFLNSSQFSCAELSDCSGHGSCVYQDTCLCDAGWSGLDCSAYSCVDIYECSSRGQCIGPNLCQCDSGWLQPDCSTASCVLQRNCSNRGVCSLPNV